MRVGVRLRKERVGATGKSKNGMVTIFGMATGSFITFVEEWSDTSDGFGPSHDDTSSCVISARMALDGAKFEGTYRNVQFGTLGQIVGVRRSEPTGTAKFRLKDAPVPSNQSPVFSSAALRGQALLCLAHSHMAGLVADEGAIHLTEFRRSQLSSTESVSESDDRMEVLKTALSRPFLSSCSLSSSTSLIESSREELRRFYSPPIALKDIYGIRNDQLLSEALQDNARYSGYEIPQLPDVSVWNQLVAVSDEVLARWLGVLM